MKSQIRVIGIDDSPFDKGQKDKVLVIGTMFRGGDFLDGVLSCYVSVDGSDATSKIIRMIRSSKFCPQLQCIFLDGIAVAGFNVIDIQQLNKETSLPVIVVIRNKPDLVKIKKALKNLKDGEEKMKMIEGAGVIHYIGGVYCQIAGIDTKEAIQFLKVCSTRSKIPEALRISHIIGSGVTKGESSGDA
ncbi:DUF99 family protein [Candidatus Woesearchaeota archaeon]|nr:DUF99 family protein [Candidatus Woesearchaeota archaeon]